MNLVLRELTAASGMTLTKTGATAQSQTVANANAQSQQFNANSHKPTKQPIQLSLQRQVAATTNNVTYSHTWQMSELMKIR